MKTNPKSADIDMDDIGHIEEQEGFLNEEDVDDVQGLITNERDSEAAQQQFVGYDNTAMPYQ